MTVCPLCGDATRPGETLCADCERAVELEAEHR
jgi:uncharacterized OB-fold protein